MDRIFYAVFGAGFGAVLGVVGWWFYGLSLSIRYHGPGIDPDLLHWVKAGAAIFAVLGFLFRDRVGEFVGNTLSALFRFESGSREESHLTPGQIAIVLVLVAALAWYILH